MFAPALLSLILTAAPSLSTTAEQSNFVRTGRYEEAARLCRAFAAAFPSKVRCEQFGTTPEGRAMLSLVASGDGTLTAEANRRRRRQVLLFQGGIHAGEIDGKDAGFWALRDLLTDKALTPLLNAVTVVFVPIFNIDGHERFAPNHRPNQNGPAEMGWRTTAQNLNLNRDYVKADSPEMESMLMLLGKWDPILYADLHVTDGAQFQHDVAVMIEPRHAGPDALRAEGNALTAELMKKLSAQGHLPLDFYPSFERDDEPASGFSYGVAPPRFSNAYYALHNRFGLLLETHSWKSYAHRVKATRDVILDLCELAAANGNKWRQAADAADELDRRGAEPQVVLTYEQTDAGTPIDFQGYAYKQELSNITGEKVIRYDEQKPQVWKVPFYADLKPELTATLPEAGYIVPAAYAASVGQKLKLHGLSYEVLSKAVERASVEVFRATSVKFKDPYEGRTRAAVEGKWAAETMPIPAGSLFVPVRQRGKRLLAHLLEPKAPDSLLTWGFFNGAFEVKEYIEAYVLEPYARHLVAEDKATREEFQKLLASDAGFAKNAEERLNFFYRRHPAWDDRVNRYPIFRAQKKP
jgi:hypothetical protein